MTTMRAKFAGTCKQCGGRIAVGDAIRWDRSIGALHIDAATCDAAKAAKAALVASREANRHEVDATAVVALLQGAKDKGLLWPAALFLAPTGGELRLSLAGPESIPRRGAGQGRRQLGRPHRARRSDRWPDER